MYGPICNASPALHHPLYVIIGTWRRNTSETMVRIMKMDRNNGSGGHKTKCKILYNYSVGVVSVPYFKFIVCIY